MGDRKTGRCDDGKEKEIRSKKRKNGEVKWGDRKERNLSSIITIRLFG